ncbi:MarR family winged helix-turn-helix transcriptional regulator [Niveispirillum sp. KHB5.9]|uniref:MarR family winged helix-turn-helix transcriptional regulator n=1 Tax=Niveispirillum sp. KHB5.9 TaxID=3400269 RepID=UPI003A87FE51
MVEEGSGKDKGRTAAAPTVTRDALLVEGRDDAFRAFVHAALAFSSRLTAVRDGFGRLIGLTGPQYTILVSIDHLQELGDVNVKTVAEHLSLSGTFVTTEVNKLVAKGLVRKLRDTNDSRRVLLLTTPAGRRKLVELSQVQQPVNDAHFGSLSAPDFAALRRLMPVMVADTDRALELLDRLARGERPAE